MTVTENVLQPHLQDLRLGQIWINFFIQYIQCRHKSEVMQEYKNSKLKQNACIQVQTKNFFSFHLVLPNQQCNQIQHGGKISKKALFGYVCMEQASVVLTGFCSIFCNMKNRESFFSFIFFTYRTHLE